MVTTQDKDKAQSSNCDQTIKSNCDITQKIQIVTKLKKKSICDKILKLKLRQNLKSSNCDQTKKNCDKTQTFKL